MPKNIILFMTDGREGVTANDKDIAALLRKSGKPLLLVVNLTPSEFLTLLFFMILPEELTT